MSIELLVNLDDLDLQTLREDTIIFGLTLALISFYTSII
jgi:hypothetical protein